MNIVRVDAAAFQVVGQDGAVISGPFPTEQDAWRWVDRAEPRLSRRRTPIRRCIVPRDEVRAKAKKLIKGKLVHGSDRLFVRGLQKEAAKNGTDMLMSDIDFERWNRITTRMEE